MKRAISINTLFLSIFLTVSSGCSPRSANTSTSNAGTNANTTVEAPPAGEPAAAGAQSPAAAAESLIADLYKQHDGKKSPFFQTKSRPLLDKYFTKPIADLIWKDATSSGDEVGAIDADPLYAAQDMEIKNFAIGKADVKGETATIPVNFTNYGQKQTINFALRQVKGEWRIDDIKYSASDSLMKWLKDTYPDKGKTVAAADGTFDGRYQVGPTSCTVTPSKMSYEIRWAKGKGVEMFFYKDENTFESASDAGNSFVFDDDKLNTGTFYRSDGKTFAVKRAR